MKGNKPVCGETREQLTEYLAGEMAAAKADRVRGHLAQCADCRAEARDLASALDAVRDAFAAASDAPAMLDGARHARIRAARRPALVRFLTDPTMLARAAALILLLGGITAVMLSALMPAQSRSLRRASARFEVSMRDAPVAEREYRDLDRNGEAASFGYDRPRESAPPAPAVELQPVRRARVAAPAARLEPDVAYEEWPAPPAPPPRGEPAPLPRPVAPPPGAVHFEAPPAEIRMDLPAMDASPPPAALRDDIVALDIRQSAERESSLVMRGLFSGRTAAGRREQIRRHMTDPNGLVELPADFAPAPESAPPPRDARESDMLAVFGETGETWIGLGAPALEDKDRKTEDVAQEQAARAAEGRAVVPTVTLALVPVFNAFMDAAEHPFSTFSMDVDTASYSLLRAYVRGGSRPPPEWIRTEEIVNAFDYDYTPPAAGVFAVDASVLPSPFRPGLHVLRIGVKARRVGRDQDRRALLTLVVDTSGSMDTPDRLGRIRAALPRLVEALAPEDEIALVHFDRRARLVLAPTPAAARERILAAIDGLAVGGGTNLEAGLALGYQVAAQHYRAGASNRVMLLTDGVANLGATTAEELLAAVAAHRRQGIYLSVLGFGIGTYDDDLLKTLAQRGDGAYVFIDSEAEAQRVLVDDLAATLHTVANDAKIQVEFDPGRVVRYRQIGYERRQLAREDFRDDTVDAGEVGSGQSVTALYEVELAEMPGPAAARRPLATVYIRYQDVETGRVEEQARRIGERDRVARFEEAPPRTRLAVVAAEFAEVLRGNPFAAGTTMADVTEQLRPVAEALPLDGQVQELLDLVETSRRQPGW